VNESSAVNRKLNEVPQPDEILTLLDSILLRAFACYRIFVTIFSRLTEPTLLSPFCIFDQRDFTIVSLYADSRQITGVAAKLRMT
jgi:hypothetical protein